MILNHRKRILLFALGYAPMLLACSRIDPLKCKLQQSEPAISETQEQHEDLYSSWFNLSSALLSEDPEITGPAIKAITEKGKAGFMILHYMWIAESNPVIRHQILSIMVEFNGMPNEMYDAKFPEKWVKASKRFASPEKEVRLEELKQFFPKEISRYRLDLRP